VWSLLIELFENGDHDGLLEMPDASVRTIDFAVELDGKELPCWAVNYNFE